MLLGKGSIIGSNIKVSVRSYPAHVTVRGYVGSLSEDDERWRCHLQIWAAYNLLCLLYRRSEHRDQAYHDDCHPSFSAPYVFHG